MRFSAFFADGHIIEQTEDDVSDLDPTKSKFFDVQEYAKLSRIITFAVGDQLAVNLTTGRFTANGVQISVPDTNIPPGIERRLIYFRRNTVTFTGDERRHDVQIVVGWQATVDGRNVQAKLAIDES